MYIDINKIILKGQCSFGKNIYYPMYSKSNGIIKHILITSPILMVSNINTKWNLINFSTETISSNIKLNNFNKYIKNIEKLVSTNELFNNSNKIFKSNIQYWNGNRYLKSNLSNKINIYNFDNTISDINSIGKMDTLKALIWVKCAKTTDNIISLELEIIQLKKYDIVVPDKCLIIDYNSLDQDNNSLDHDNNNELYSKYYKMLKMGINKRAVIQKCIIDGVDPSFLTDEVVKKPVKLNLTDFSNNLLENLSSQRNKLKKGKPILKKKVVKNTNQLIPTLNDIINMKERLKSTKVKNE